MHGLTRNPFGPWRGELAACVALTVLLALISLAPALTVGVILDRVIQTRAFATLLAVLLAFAIFHACELVFTYVHDRLMLYVTHSAVVAAETAFWESVGQTSYAEIERLSHDDAHARFVGIGTDIRFQADWAVASVSIPLCLVIAMSALFLVSPALAWPIALLSAIFCIANLGLTRSQRMAARELRLRHDAEMRAVGEMFEGAASLKAHRAFDFGFKRWLLRKSDHQVALVRWSTACVMQGLVSLSFERVSLLFVLGIGAHEVVAGRLSVGQLVMANMLLRQVAAQVRQVAPLLQRRTAYRASLAKMADFIRRKERGATAASGLRLASAAEVVARDLSFRTAEGRSVIEQVSFELPRGKSLAIVGASGSGKTTLLKLLSGLYVPCGGVLLVGGAPPLARADLVYLSQREHLFDCPLTENILLGRGVPESASAVLEHLDLGKHLFAGGGLRSASLSGGERQRVFVARALAQSGSLFLDEPSTALDTDRRSGVLELLRAVARYRVLVFATHDEELAAMADYTLELSGGRVVRFASRITANASAPQQAQPPRSTHAEPT